MREVEQTQRKIKNRGKEKEKEESMMIEKMKREKKGRRFYDCCVTIKPAQ